jgi:hypothetical protein
MTTRTLLVMSAMLLVPRLASACPVCFGASDGPMLRGSSMGILALLAVTLGMFAAFGAFFLHLARRASAQAEATTSPGRQPWQGERTR